MLREIRDPRLDFLISITHVEVSPDLNTARISVSVMAEPKQQADAVHALNAASGFLHRELKHRIQMRRVPFLFFKLDTSIEEGARILSQIDDALREDSEHGVDPA